eukprot:GHUV01006414.1.p1 GENE.GHUV01006414.1~~GHUV01006414.1.p1  ORF type:complete len:263 (-),score=75.76 GHUV01006414.1:406-1194(-)
MSSSSYTFVVCSSHSSCLLRQQKHFVSKSNCRCFGQPSISFPMAPTGLCSNSSPCCGPLQAGKKTYTLLMGKPNPAKLANFPEIEVFVMLADPQGLILDSKEYLNPIITPHEAYLAFTNKDFDAAAYRLDFVLLFQYELQQQGQAGTSASESCSVSAVEVGGNVSNQADADSDSDPTDDKDPIVAQLGALVIAGATSNAVSLGASSRTGQQAQVHSAAQYLTQLRTYKGLETPATGGEIIAAKKAVPGRSGRAAVYVDEPIA